MGSKVSSGTIATTTTAATTTSTATTSSSSIAVANNNNNNNNNKEAVVRHATFITGGCWGGGEFGPKIYSFHASRALPTYSGKGRLEAGLNVGK